MPRLTHIRMAGIICVMMTSTLTAFPTPVGTAFSYQGVIKAGGSPLTGTADFQFTLFDAASGPTQIGSTVAVNNVSVSNGVMNATLDFGALAFDGNDRFLQIAVRSPAGSGGFTTLTPRQKLSATPYALQTRGMFADGAGNVGIGTTTPSAPLHIASDAFPVINLQDTGSPSTQAGYVSYRNNANVETGWVGYGNPGSPQFSIVNARAGGDVVLYTGVGGIIQLATNVFAVTVTSAGNVGIGTAAPSSLLSVNGNADFSGTVDFNGDVLMGDTSAGGRLLMFTSDSEAIFATNTANNGVGVRGRAMATTGTVYGVVGEAASAAGFDFFASGAGVNYGAPSSIRWKRNIELIDDPLEKVAQMRGVTFDWDAAHGGQHDVGFIGEEVGKVLPEIVAYEKGSQFVTGMDYSKLTPLLVEAVKALRTEKDAQIEQLQHDHDQQIASLQHDNQQLQDRLASLESTVAHLTNQKENH